MSGWVKIDDAFTEHPKYLRIGPLGGYLSFAAIAWANRNLTDGFIPHEQVSRLVDFTGFGHHIWTGDIVGGGDDANAADLAHELVAVGLWEEVENGYQIHDYHDWQSSRGQILAAREDSRKRQQKSRAQRGAGANGAVADASQRDALVSHGHVTALKKEEVRSKKEEGITEEERQNTTVELRSTMRDLFVYWQEKCGHPNSKFVAKRKRAVEGRLKEGYTAEQIRDGIDGAAHAPYINDQGKKFDDIELICRDGAKLESFIERKTMAPTTNSLRPVALQRADRWKAGYE